MDSLSIGEFAEQMFTVKAILNGFRVSRPIGHASSYDFIIEKEGRLHRIQVKSTFTKRKNRNNYQVSVVRGNSYARRRDSGYDENAFDYYAVYIKPLDRFFIIPKKEITVQTVCINSNPEKNLYEKYREKWDM